MATETLSTSINSGIVLGASESYENLTVLGTGTINAPNIGVSGDGGSDIRLDKGAFVSGMQDGVASDATLTNAGTISGQTFGVDQLGRYVSNSGTISGITAAINIESGTLSNSSTGIIQGGIGIYSNTGSQKTIVNAGTIIGNGGSAGISIGEELNLTNSGTISGGTALNIGFYTQVQNTGTIAGQTIGAKLDGSTLNNTGGISGVSFGIELNGFLTNSGTISSQDTALYVDGGRATNAGTGDISGSQIGVALEDYSQLKNFGTISGAVAVATTFGGQFTNYGTISGVTTGLQFSSGFVKNVGGGSIYGEQYGAVISFYGSLNNAGTVAGQSYGLELQSGATALNSGLITSQYGGVYLSDPNPFRANFLNNTGTIYGKTGGLALKSGTVQNSGAITGGTVGAVLLNGDLITNSGKISGPLYGVVLHSGSLDNTGGITGSLAGVAMYEGYVTNAGIITGQTFGVLMDNGTITNAGTITGPKDAVYGINLVVDVDPGAVFNGKVEDPTYAGMLNLTGTGSGSLSGIGVSLTGFDRINFYPGAAWAISGNSAALARGELIDSFGRGDVITLTGFAAASHTYVPFTGLILREGARTETLDLVPVFPASDFTIVAVDGNTEIFAPQLISIISTGLTSEVKLGGGTYATDVTVTSTGSVTAGTAIYAANSITGANVLNEGHISGGVLFENVATLVNQGSIGGTMTSVDLVTGGSVNNSGFIGAAGASSVGIQLTHASLNNSGTIGLAGTGVLDRGYTNITNTNIITGTQTGIVLGAHSTLNNSGFIAGAIGVDDGRNYIAILNTGTITGSRGGVLLSAFSGLDNTGSIGGGTYGVLLANGGTMTNAGIISGGTYAIEDSGALTLTVDPGAVFEGAVSDRFGPGELVLAAGEGSLDMGGSFSGFSSIAFASGATWSLEGSTAALAGGETISGLTIGDVIELDGFAATSRTYVAGVGLILNNGSQSETLDITGGFSTNEFLISDNADGGTDITAPCFVAGTRIATPRGKTRVERLRIGDLVKSMHGGFTAVKWIGTRRYDGRFIAGNHLMLPVRIRRHAIAKNIPSRDLYVSPDHAICEGGVLVPAWRLVNGVSITQAARVESVSYFHVELEQHDIIFAENCPSESFLDTGIRGRFDNAKSFSGPETLQTSRLPRVADGFYLEVIRRRIAARAGISAPSGAPGALRGFVDEAGPGMIRGWAQDFAAPENPVELEVLARAGVVARVLANVYRPDLRAAGLGSGCHGFALALDAGLAGPVAVRRRADGVALPFGAGAAVQAA
jgi:hypothetical protein